MNSSYFYSLHLKILISAIFGIHISHVLDLVFFFIDSIFFIFSIIELLFISIAGKQCYSYSRSPPPSPHPHTIVSHSYSGNCSVVNQEYENFPLIAINFTEKKLFCLLCVSKINLGNRT